VGRERDSAAAAIGSRLGWAAELPLVPKEHGASFMSAHALLLGIVAGVAAGGRDAWGALLALAFGALFLPLAAAVSVWSHPRLGAASRRRAAVLAAVLLVAGALALLHGPARQILALGCAGAVLGGSYAAARLRTGPRSVATQLAAIAGICLLAPLAWLLVAGATIRWPLSAVAAFGSFGGSVPYVRERVRRRRFPSLTRGERLRGGLPALLWQAVALLTAGTAAAAGLVHPLVPVAFLPGAGKVAVAIARPETRPPIRRIGVVETVISSVFAVLAGIGLGVSP
jgi:hypothetical protein